MPPYANKDVNEWLGCSIGWLVGDFGGPWKSHWNIKLKKLPPYANKGVNGYGYSVDWLVENLGGS